jgi:formate hydrogenlyase transcriptional activator
MKRWIKVKGFEAGGVDYITKPFQAEEVVARVKIHLLLQRLRNRLEDVVEERTAELRQANDSLRQEIAERQRVERELQESYTEIQRLKDQLHAENIYLQQEIRLEHNFDEIIGHSQALKYLLFKVEQVAATETTILITGETGTGKELIARAIHQASPRNDRPLVKVNCAALPTHLIESELFGHEKGAFTGAIMKQIGRFELADGATIFLDEIGELPLELQPKLLRVLQEGEFERLGHPRTIRVNVRVIAATNRNLKAEMNAGRFRQDLYYRLNVYPLSVPPLREHPEDIPLLVRAFVQKISKRLGKQIDFIPESTLQALRQYTWPGNIRELENIIERAVITTQDTTLHVELPETPAVAAAPTRSLAEVEREYILQVLKAKQWRIEGPKGAALVLDMHPNTLRTRMQKLGIRKPRRKEH